MAETGSLHFSGAITDDPSIPKITVPRFSPDYLQAARRFPASRANGDASKSLSSAAASA